MDAWWTFHSKIIQCWWKLIFLGVLHKSSLDFFLNHMPLLSPLITTARIEKTSWNQVQQEVPHNSTMLRDAPIPTRGTIMKCDQTRPSQYTLCNTDIQLVTNVRTTRWKGSACSTMRKLLWTWLGFVLLVFFVWKKRIVTQVSTKKHQRYQNIRNLGTSDTFSLEIQISVTNVWANYQSNFFFLF